MIDVSAYLQRIDYRGPTSPTASVLRALHRAHLFTVPFENLDIHLGRRLSLSEDALFDKIVTRRRGGFCYEVNGLFAALLRALGFEVTLLSARVARPEGGFGPDRDHLALRVRAAGEPPFLADVGFGDSFVTPLLLDELGEQMEGTMAYWLADEGPATKILLRRAAGGGPEPQYVVSLEPREPGDFEEMCVYHQTSAESPFPKKRLCTRATPEGRLTLREGSLVTTTGGDRKEQPVETASERASALRDYFGIHLD